MSDPAPGPRPDVEPAAWTAAPGRLAAGFVDRALDLAIVPGYGAPGLTVRRRLPGWPADPPSLSGRAVLVTGAAAGLGQATAIGYARLGARVHVHARSPERAREASDAVRAAVPGADVHPEHADLSELRAVHAFAAGLAARVGRLHVLVHNAGVMVPERTHTPEGHELTFATHVLAPFALTAGLRPVLSGSAADPGRVITVSSGGMYGQRLPDVRDPESERASYRPAAIYARTKRQQVALTEMWGRTLAAEHVVAHATHPGWASTGGVVDALPGFARITRPILRSAEQGADTAVWLGAAPEAARCTGAFWHDRRRRPTRWLIGPGDGTRAQREALWDYCGEALAAALSPAASV